MFKSLEFQEDELAELITRYSNGANQRAGAVGSNVTASSSNSSPSNMRASLASTSPKEQNRAADEKENASKETKSDELGGFLLNQKTPQEKEKQ